MSNKTVEFDISALTKALDKMGNVDKHIAEGAKNGMERAGTIWKNKVFRDAPYDTGNLVDGVGDVEVSGEAVSTLVSEFEVGAWSKWRGKPFNYAYYIHEVKGRKGMPDPFIDEAYDKVKSRVKNAIEDEIAKSLEKAGF